MKKSFFFILAISFGLFLRLEAKSLNARFSTATFFAPGEGPYVETYFQVSGASAYYKQLPNGKFQASIEVTLSFSDNGKIRYFDKYNLLGPETADTLKELHDFTDQKRVSLPNGTYTVEMVIHDNNDGSNKPYFVKKDINVNLYPNIVALSDIQLVRDFKAVTTTGPLVKNGMEIIPMVDNFYPSEMNALKFYAEAYNTHVLFEKDAFLFSYHIETYEQHRELPEFKRISRQQSKPVNVLLTEFDISTLPSGNYNLIVELRDRQNNVVSEKEFFFQRSKIQAQSTVANGEYKDKAIANTFVAFLPKDSLSEYIKCIWPIASPNENSFAMNQLEMGNLDMMQKFFFDFWQHRNPENPEAGWLTYKAEVDKVNVSFKAGNKKGYMTERGRVYLQYGPPNQISQSYNEPDTYPYEIWQYYKVGTQSNRKFIFYCPEIAINDFRLLHSDAKGEIYEEQWQLILKKRTNVNNNFDTKSPEKNFGNQYDQIFNNPR